jgi:hypothetical protein
MWSVNGPGGKYWNTMPMTCPACLLDWNTNGLSLAIRDNARRFWGAPTTGATSTVAYECLGCGHRVYDDRRGAYKTPRRDDSAARPSS